MVGVLSLPMRKLLPVLTFLLFLFPISKVSATVTFSAYQTPEGLTPYKEYLGDGGSTAKLSSDQPKVFYHYPEEDYLLGGITVFIHTRDAVTGEAFAPDLTKLKLVFGESGNEYLGSVLGEIVYDNAPWGATWPVTFLTEEELSKEVWHKITITADDPDQERHKMWLAQRDYTGGGLRGEEYPGSPGNFARGPVSVFFKGKATIPSYRPIVLIHGLGGHFTDWERDGNKYVVRQALAEMMLTDPSGFNYTPEWIHNFSYGFIDPINDEPYYNYQGNIIDIAKELGPVLDDLSALSLGSGGDGLVDVVGFSLGGVVAREYMRQNPEDHRLGKVVTVAAPHRGANLVELKDDVLWWFGPVGYGIEEILTRAIKPFCRPGQPLDTESFAVKQLLPSSAFIYNLNEKPLDPEDGFYTIGSNMKLFVEQDVFLFGLKASSQDLGDLVVLSESALNIPPVGETRTLFEDEINLGIGAIKLEVEGLQVLKAFKQTLDTDPMFRYWHMRLIQQPEVIKRIVEVLNG